ncbi:MAG: response regulator [Clostridia bacterium]|nr:response regulator [Clostridia bacterium]
MNILIADDEHMVLEETKEVVEEVRPEAGIFTAEDYIGALEAAKNEQIDVALLDIEMPGMSGLDLAKRLKELNPDMNIIFVTAYAGYALDAFKLYASGYLMKPLQNEHVEKAFANLRHLPPQEKPKLKVQCFGNFEVFHKGQPVVFARGKAKEVFAYLVDLKGAAANTGELCAILWEDSIETDKNKHYLRNLIADIRRALQECQAEEVFYSKRNQFAIYPDKLECDYYEYLKGNQTVINSYQGEYMKQYSWAELSMRHIT